MIVAERKPFDEIKAVNKRLQKSADCRLRHLCCCLPAGGEKEVGVLNAELKLSQKAEAEPADFW